MENKKFLIIDGNSIMNRAYYGLMNMRMTSSILNIHTNALYAFLNIYWMTLDRFKPDYVAVSFDLKAPTFRHEMYKEYKGTRHAMPEELKEQMPVIKKILMAMNVPIIELEGYEADDILGTISNTNEKNNVYTYILTGDRDSFQLISSLTAVVMPSNKPGKTEYTVFDPQKLKEKYGIEPYQVIEVKSLMGDASDNIPGVKGVGEKTAYSLIQNYGNIEYIYNNIDNIELKPKVKEKLLLDKDMANLSHTLATIDINVPIKVDYDKAKLTEVNKEELYKLFKDLEFNKFLSKYDFSDISIEEENKTSNEPKIDTSIKDIITIDNVNYDKYKFVLEQMFKNGKISYIFNISSKNFTSSININDKDFIAIYNHKDDTIYVINIDSLGNDSLTYILKTFSTSSCKKIGYNIKQDLLYLFNNKISDNIQGFDYDLMIAYYLLNSNNSHNSISNVLNDLFNITLNLNYKKEAVQISFFDSIDNSKKEFLDDNEKNIICSYLKGIYLSYDVIIKKLEEVNMLSLFNDIEMPLAETLASMENVGMYIDKEKLKEFDIEITQKLNDLENTIYTLAGENFNINSTQQLGKVLFEKLELPVVKKTKTGYSTDKDVLEKLEEYHDIIPKLLEYRQLNKLKTTYVDSLKEKIDEDGRIHTTFMQTVTTTGRLSSVEPNLQNIPIRLQIGKKIRSFFVGQNNNSIMDADYSQIELRVLADVANDSVMINSFNEGIDIHKTTASQVFDVPLNEVTDEMRSHAKAVNFGIVYGISGFGLAKNIGTSRKKATEYIEKYLNKYPGIHEFMNNIVKEATENGYVSTLFNRRRYIPELREKNKNIVEFGKRIAMNTPIQGTAADIIKIAMNRIYKALKDNNLKSKLIMQVHDELIIEVIPDEEDKVKSIMKKEMENVVSLKVPLTIDLNVGKSWYDAH